ncbi:hypothetical protein LCGC14_0561020 [marine sediment metagenome]|uniref:Uncharacterized protein n=1 Tax=marine sediment metagenome TaxID=412755 RepID=A0A0F9U8H0_9ZZZZ
MDTSEQYIKMCNCPEIQGIFAARPEVYYGNWIPGDFFYRWDTKENGVYEKAADEEGYYYNGKLDNATWLPRQDQLQEMVGDLPEATERASVELLGCFTSWCYTEDARGFRKWTPGAYQFTSMEQLWLAFCMHELHSKTWDGDKWKDV